MCTSLGLIERAKQRERFDFPKVAKMYKTWKDIKHLELLPKMMIIMPKSGFCPRKYLLAEY